MEQQTYRNNWLDQQMNQFNVEWKESGIRRIPKTGWTGKFSSTEYTLGYVAGGSGQLRSMGGEYAVHAGNAVLLPMGMVFTFHAESDCEILFFQFSMRTDSGFPFSMLSGDIRILDVGPRVLEMTEWYRRTEPGKAMKLRLYLYSDIIALSDSRPVHGGEETASYSRLTKTALETIHAKPSIRMTVAGVAEQMKVSPSTLRKRFQAETGISMGVYLDTQVYRRAASLLISTDMQVGEIAEQLGFCDQFYFCRFFKRFEGMTPTRYRQRTRG